MTSQRATDWAPSARPNWWRRENGTPLIVGMSKYGRIWARVRNDFLDKEFAPISEARVSCERETPECKGAR